MDMEEYIEFWLKGAEHDLAAAEALYYSKNYDWSLFIGHLVLEKVLKALIIQNTGEPMPPKMHNLSRLAIHAKLELSEEQTRFLIEANKFHIEARYPDYKNTFYKLCDQNYASNQLNRIKEVYKCLKLMIK